MEVAVFQEGPTALETFAKVFSILKLWRAPRALLCGGFGLVMRWVLGICIYVCIERGMVDVVKGEHPGLLWLQ